MNESRPNSERSDRSTGAFIVYFLALSYSTMFTVFLRRGFGSEALGYNGLAALGMLVFLADGDPPTALFFLLWLVALVVQRIITFRRARQGIRPHSHFGGEPYLVMRLLPFANTAEDAAAVEAFLCLIVGALLLPISEHLGSIIMLGFISILFQRGVESHVWSMRVRRLRDAEIEQRTLVELYEKER